MDKDKRDEPKRTEKPLILDMGLGSREQGFQAQEPEPKLKLVRSREAAPA